MRLMQFKALSTFQFLPGSLQQTKPATPREAGAWGQQQDGSQSLPQLESSSTAIHLESTKGLMAEL